MSYYSNFLGSTIDGDPIIFTLTYNCHANPKVRISAIYIGTSGVAAHTFTTNEDLVRHVAGETHDMTRYGNTFVFGDTASDRFAHVRIHYDLAGPTLQIERGYASKIGILGIIDADHVKL